MAMPDRQAQERQDAADEAAIAQAEYDRDHPVIDGDAADREAGDYLDFVYGKGTR
jgi:hypothetical protein